MDNIRITLETLYDILRNEKKKEDLQKLDPTFYNDVINYLKEKKTLLEQKGESNELFAAGEKEKVEYELRSIKRILKELYEKREKKVIDIALNKSRTGSDIINTEAMLKEEKEFYDKLLKILDLYRRGVLLNLFKCELPRIVSSLEEKKEEIKKELEESSAKLEEKKSEPTKPSPDHPPPEVQSSEATSTSAKPTESKEGESKEETSVEEMEEAREETEKETEKETRGLKKIKFIHPVPSFVWKDMKVYGPFDEGEEIEIFPEVADLLVRKGRAEMV